MGRLDGEVVLITGGASGLGRAIVDRFVEEGARLTVFDKSEARLVELGDTHGSAVRAVVGDVRSIEDVTRAVDTSVESFGKLDTAIGNAGIWDYSKSLDDLPASQLDATFDEIFHINVKGYLTLAKAALPALVRSQGAMIFTVSNAGFHPNGGGPLYTASKHAVVGLIRQLAFELAPEVRVNGVAPGPIDSDLRGPEALGMSDRAISRLNLPDKAGAAIPLGHVPKTEEYAGAYLQYASRRDCAASTGGVMICDAGIGVRGIGITSGGGRLKEKYAE